jgi:hypothetical protein
MAVVLVEAKTFNSYSILNGVSGGAKQDRGRMFNKRAF